MKRLVLAMACVVLVTSLGSFGCARAARDTSGFAMREEATLNASFEDAWHATKRVLLDQGYEIYTRDKRGTFVAYTPMKRLLWTQPRRTKVSVELAQKSPEETAIAVESVRQVYGVTLMTHPNWHDRKQTNPKQGQDLVAGITAKLAEGLESETLQSEAPEAPAAAETPAADAPAPEMETKPLPAPETTTVEEAAPAK